MQFVLNNTKVNDDAIPPDLTLLRYLREHKNLCGTKEGCASGDCGACTVMVGSLVHHDNGDTIEYKTVNSCITPAAVSAAKHIVTVEHLSQDKALHPAQAAMVDCHGSQCGFCTPGFVVSLACMHEENKTVNATKNESSHDINTQIIKPQRTEVCEAISGNLCRCTGYRPIIDAGISLNNYESTGPLYTPEILAFLQSMEANTLNSTHHVGDLSTIQANTTGIPHYYYPRDLAELNHLMTEYPSAKLIAGGTDLVLEITQRYESFSSFIDLSRVTEMNCCVIPTTPDNVVIGATVTYSDLEHQLTDQFPEFTQLLKRFASRQIRNRGTIGGNIANGSPIADMPPILLALDAELHIGSADGKTRICALNDFYLGYKKIDLNANEYIISVQFPKKYLTHFLRFYKVSKRIEDDISSVMLAVRFDIQNEKIVSSRIAYGGMAAIPLRVSAAETALTDALLNDETYLLNAIEQITNTLHPMSDVRASAAYRSQIAGNLLIKTWQEAKGHTLPNLPITNPDNLEYGYHA